ncbi:MAG: hypothetical protein ACRD2F_01730 [Terriglobales bacterium]
MNGGRLSDDEAMAQGLAMLRAGLAAGIGASEPPAQALRMIAMRYPEEAERLEADWRAGEAARVQGALAAMEQQFAEDCAE